ncbi:integrin alpha-L-like isoform X1 [Clupea harengus]|uniref:Integrin alpha-L-like isoform X1 n=1 Tax=Clupea harengus TaxID=7950 RepID=A0A6P8F4D8_CLUHA|nr:integrin alpha-L-like isoform X1 [Clupea harengus]
MKTEALHKTLEEAHWNSVGSVRPLSVNPVVRAFRRMAVLRSLHLVVLWAAVSYSMAFNIDVAGPKIYTGSGPGYKSLHFQSGTEKGSVFRVPLQRNGNGGVFICDDTNPDCKSVPLPSAAEANSKECTKQNVDLVFLFDGSLSMKNEDFVKNKEVIKTIMKSMSNTSIQFAAVQFSKVSRTVFTFKDYQDNKAFKKLDDEEHMKSLTHTHGAMHYALNNLFDESESGRHPDATKVVVIITDGNPSDPARVKVNGTSKNIVEIYEDRHIMRFVIGVCIEYLFQLSVWFTQ